MPDVFKPELKDLHPAETSDNAFDLVADFDNFVVVDKAPGISFHIDEGRSGLCILVSEHLGKQLFPVHRLDKATSGLVVLAKNQDFARSLTEQFSTRTTEKYYLAIAQGKPAKKQGWIIGDMHKTRKGNWKLTRQQTNPAVTQFLSKSLAPGQRAYLLKPHTGKTHQLRVALKSIGVPIVGDDRYGGETSERMYLHAFGLGFDDGEARRFFLQRPRIGQLFNSAAFGDVLEEWRLPQQQPWSTYKALTFCSPQRSQR